MNAAFSKTLKSNLLSLFSNWTCKELVQLLDGIEQFGKRTCCKIYNWLHLKTNLMHIILMLMVDFNQIVNVILQFHSLHRKEQDFSKHTFEWLIVALAVNSANVSLFLQK